MIFDEETLKEVVTKIAGKLGFDEDQAERMAWILDTLDVLTQVPPEGFDVFLKGGTCVQHYMPSQSQRFSKDIDIGMSIQRSFQDVKSYVQHVNAHLKTEGYSGILRSRPGKPRGDIIVFDRFFDPLFCEPQYHGLHEREGCWIMVEFDTKERSPLYEELKLALLPALHGEVSLRFNCATRGKLLSDKIIASMGPYYDAREEIKDLLDLNLMLSEPEFQRCVPEARDLIRGHASQVGVSYDRIIGRAASTMGREEEEMNEEKLATAVNAILPREHRFEDLAAWREHCEKTINLFERFFLSST